ncbi:MAG: periplasmic heavy metal sensor [Gemmatimonadota bacterium]
MITRRLFATSCLGLACLAVAGPLESQITSSVDDPIARSLFEPELIMTHRRAINLSDEQRDAISRLIRELQGQVVSLQWDLKEHSEALGTELSRPRVDLDRARDRLDRVLATEGRIKAAHLTLLIRIKNILRPEQQEALGRLRAGA